MRPGFFRLELGGGGTLGGSRTRGASGANGSWKPPPIFNSTLLWSNVSTAATYGGRATTEWRRQAEGAESTPLPPAPVVGAVGAVLPRRAWPHGHATVNHPVDFLRGSLAGVSRHFRDISVIITVVTLPF